MKIINIPPREEASDDVVTLLVCALPLAPTFIPPSTQYHTLTIMFRKPKRSAKAALRSKKRKSEDEQDGAAGDKNDSGDEDETLQLVEEARRASKKTKGDDSETASNKLMHHYETSSEQPVLASDLATRTAQHHDDPEQQASAKPDDGIYRDKTRNKFLAGPLKASAFVRTTCRFDYQPDICKDYKDTGFCGFGDTCIYLHDRGDTLSGWQLEQQWEEQRKKDLAQRELDAFAGTATKDEAPVNSVDDGLPFACHICRKPFTQPVVTSCGHYFCEQCIMNHVRENVKGTCPICGKDTHGVFNQPTKLLMKKRRLLGSKATWQEFADASSSSKAKDDDAN